MYELKITHQFKKSLRLCVRRGLDPEKMRVAINHLQATGTLPPEYQPHPLVGNRKLQMEAHIEPDWLIIWEVNNHQLILYLVDTGTHSDLFKK